MKAHVLALAAAVAAVVSTRAAAAPLVVVLRDGGDAMLAVTRLRGQLADLDVALAIVPGAIEPALAAQLATAARLAAAQDARAVVWFVPRGGGLAVAIATPGDRRLFVREIPAADPSAVAEAAAVAARGALRAIGDGGTIGVEVAPVRLAAPVMAPPPIGLELAIGWQIALDAGADAGAHAVAQRTSVTRGPWAAVLALTLGPALRHAVGPEVAPEVAPGGAPDVVIDLSRSSATLGLERRIAGFAIGVSAGAVVYHRTTVEAAPGLAPTPAATTAGFVAGPELRWQWRPRGWYVGLAVMVGVDVVLGAPELAVARGGAAVPLGHLRAIQPRGSAGIVVGLP
jgi:hypothetical protein